MSRIVVPPPASLARRGLGRALLGGLLALLAACEGGRELAPVAVQARAGAAPAPGPALLYAAPPPASQLENTGPWRAAPLLISGASAYVDGEFLYQDWLFDDHGADGGLPDPNAPAGGLANGTLADNVFSRYAGSYTYPSDPAYAHNAADLVEFRVRSVAEGVAFRLTLNTLLDPNLVAATLALGTTGEPRPLPGGANLSLDHAFSFTLAERRVVLRNAAGDTLATLPLAVDLRRRQLSFTLPRGVLNIGDSVQSLWLGVGLWDAEADQFRIPGFTHDAETPGGAGTLAQPPAYFNLAFRFAEPQPDIAGGAGVVAVIQPRWWRDAAQAAALAAGDAEAFRVRVDFGKLRRGVTDMQFDEPGGVPTHGAINRIYASRFAAGQGIDYGAACGGADGCFGILQGQLLPYALYLPDRPQPPGGWGLTLLLHSLAGNYNQYAASANQAQLGERGRGSLVLTPTGRGPDGWYVEYSGADVFEAWADAARHYRIDADYTAISGYSMGGHGTFRLATQFPDLFARAQTVVGPPAVGIWLPPLDNPGPQANTFHNLASLYHVPIQSWVASADQLVPYPGPRQQADRLFELGYRAEFWTFAPAEHLTLAAHDQYAPAADFLGDARVVRKPRHVVYVRNPQMDFPAAGIVADHAYWLSDIRVADPDAGVGVVRAESLALPPAPEPGSAERATTPGLLTPGTYGALGYVAETQTWGAAVTGWAPLDGLRLNANNIAHVAVDMAAAGLSCRAAIEVNSERAVAVTRLGC